MTREEMKELKGLAASMGLYDDKKPCKRALILGKAIKALEQEPCEDCKYNTNPRHAVCNSCICGDRYVKDEALEQEPCEDCISREEVLDLCDSKDPEYNVRYFKEDVECLPPVYPMSKTGHWEWVRYDSNPNIGNWHCSKCRTIIPYMQEETDNTPIYKQCRQYRFCPNCGAKMVEPQGSEDKE